MALSEDQIIDLFNEACRETFNGLEWFRYFARAIEAEVRKDDEALIRQMLESMCWAARVMTISEDEAPGYFAAIAAALARLEQPCVAGWHLASSL